jgi:hypothetical protein
MGGKLWGRQLCREGKGGGSSRLGIPRDRDEGLGAVVLRGEPAELEPYESECRSEGNEFSLASVGLRECTAGGESEDEF